MARALIHLLIASMACFASLRIASAAPWSQGNASADSSADINFDISRNTGGSVSYNQMALIATDDDDMTDWDLDIEEYLGPDCKETCEDFEDVCSGADRCEMLHNCTAVCHRADGSSSTLNPKDIRSAKEGKCTKSGKQCVHGKCLDDQRCECDVGYEGDLCNVKQCMLPCLHGGTCFAVRPRQYTCACTPEWQGSFCQDEKCTLPCVRGSCIYWPEDGSPFCNCPHGWTGKFCEKRRRSIK